MMMDIMREIVDERSRQDAKWGPVHLLGHDDAKWLTILMEEVGEVARDMVEGRNPRGEILQVAAVAASWLEDRKADADDPSR